MNKLPLVWETYNYLYFEKDINWKISTWTITITLAIISFLLDNVTLSILLLLSMAALMIHALQAPELYRYEINSLGLDINGHSISFSEIKSFWIVDNKKYHLPSKILFKTDSIHYNIISMPLPIETDSDDMHNIHEILVKILPEEMIKESLLRSFMEYWGF